MPHRVRSRVQANTTGSLRGLFCVGSEGENLVLAGCKLVRTNEHVRRLSGASLVNGKQHMAVDALKALLRGRGGANFRDELVTVVGEGRAQSERLPMRGFYLPKSARQSGMNHEIPAYVVIGVAELIEQ